jgi:hypothetical protein
MQPGMHWASCSDVFYVPVPQNQSIGKIPNSHANLQAAELLFCRRQKIETERKSCVTLQKVEVQKPERNG